MNRRDVVKALLTLPATAVLGGCKERSENNPSPTPPEPPASGSILRVVLHGPFAVVLQTAQNRVRAFIPFDTRREHEFWFPTPKSYVGASKQSYQFALSEAGLETNRRTPYVDHGFDDFNFRLGKWEPDQKLYFVSIDLPAPDVITYIPPSEAVIFGGQPASMPIDHILEYRVNDSRKIRISSPQLGEKPAVPLTELHDQYRKHWSDKKKDMRASDSQRGHTDEEFKRWSAYDVSTYFFGVGLPEGKYQEQDPYLKTHAIEFFNTQLRGSF